VQWTRPSGQDGGGAGGGRRSLRIRPVMVSIGAANRDPRQFFRSASFGHHAALTRESTWRSAAGNSLLPGARGWRGSKLQIGLSTLFRRLKNLRVEDGFEVTWRSGHTLHTRLIICR